MTNEALAITNNVRLIGVIVHKFETAKAVLIVISTKDAGPVINYPTVVFLKDTMEQTKDFEQYDHVTIEGNVQSSFRKNETGKQFVKQSIFGESITRTPKTLEKEFGIEGAGKYPVGENIFVINGEMLSCQVVNDGLLSMKIKTIKNNHISFVKVFYYTSNAKEQVKKYAKGDAVCGIGSIQTRKSTGQSGKVSHFENVVLQELSKK